MGQRIAVEAEAIGQTLLLSGDRSLTGQDVRTFSESPLGDDPPAILAQRLFALNLDIRLVVMQSNTVTVSREGHWDGDDSSSVQEEFANLFVVYDHSGDTSPPESREEHHEPPIGGEGRGLVVAPADSHGPLDEEVVEALRAEHYNGTIESIHRAHDSLWVLHVKPDGGVPPHSAGQYTTLALGYWEPRMDGLAEILPDDQIRKLARRSYSISSSILDGGDLIDEATQETLEFYVVLVESDWQGTPAVLTPRLFAKEEGDRIFVGKKIAGHYGLEGLASPEDNVVLLSTGTGEAPHNRMIQELLTAGHRGKILSACTVRYRRDLAYLDVHAELEERYENYAYLPLTTREPENEGNKVYIQDALSSGLIEERLGAPIDPQTTHVFLCGNPAMIGLPEWDGDEPQFPETVGVAELLTKRGFRLDRRKDPGNIHYEEYW